MKQLLIAALLIFSSNLSFAYSTCAGKSNKLLQKAFSESTTHFIHGDRLKSVVFDYLERLDGNMDQDIGGRICFFSKAGTNIYGVHETELVFWPSLGHHYTVTIKTAKKSFKYIIVEIQENRAHLGAPPTQQEDTSYYMN